MALRSDDRIDQNKRAIKAGSWATLIGATRRLLNFFWPMSHGGNSTLSDWFRRLLDISKANMTDDYRFHVELSIAERP